MLAIDKTRLSLSHEDQVFWPVYVIIDNLDIKIYPSQNWPRILLLGSILIVHEWAKNLNNKNRNLKIKIYHIAIKTMLEYI